MRVLSSRLSGHVVQAVESPYEGFKQPDGTNVAGGIKRRIFLACEDQPEPVELRFSGSAEGLELFRELKGRLFQPVWVDVEARAPETGYQLVISAKKAGPVDPPANGAAKRDTAAATH